MCVCRPLDLLARMKCDAISEILRSLDSELMQRCTRVSIESICAICLRIWCADALVHPAFAMRPLGNMLHSTHLQDDYPPHDNNSKYNSALDGTHAQANS